MAFEHKMYISEGLSQSELGPFFRQTLAGLTRELDLLKDTLYNYGSYETGDVFELTERAWMGLFNNAMRREFYDNVVTLQEYSVYDKEKGYHGRPDLLVSWKKEKRNEALMLFEAKQYEEKSTKTMLQNPNGFYTKLYKQALGYYKREEDYFKESKCCIIPLVFGWIRRVEVLDVAKSYIESPKDNTHNTAFCSLYYEGDHGVWVYGAVAEAVEETQVVWL